MSGWTSKSREGAPLPTGIVTFMFTDIEGSTQLAHSLTSDQFAGVVSKHNDLIRREVARHQGTEVSTEGDAFFAVFEDPYRAVESAIGIQNALRAEKWPEELQVKVRIGLHVGEAILGGDNYVGVDVHRAARIAHAAHGGQITLSHHIASALSENLSEDWTVTDLGRFKLSGFRDSESIFQLTSPGLTADFPPLRGVGTVSHLPEQHTSFVGRERELTTGERVLNGSRVLTLTGPGGSGKTRLSIELARRVEPGFAEGVHFISLATLTESELITVTVLEGLGMSVAPAADPTEHLLAYLADKQLLIVLDNIEQLLPSAAEVVVRLLEGASYVKLIITSRAPLKIRGERELAVPPLDVPGERTRRLGEVSSFPSVGLFLERAEAVQPGFELTQQNVNAVVELTNRLEGLPLALELAASRLKTFTPELILDRIGDRMLESHSPDVPARQQTILNTISWSYDLLDEPTRLVFERCSVFSGSFGLEQAELVAGPGDVLTGLAALVDNSLLQRADDGAEPRYRMLIVIRDYAYSALVARGDVDTYEEQHARAYLRIAEAAAKRILSSEQKTWLDKLAVDHDNLRAALNRSIRVADASTAMRLVAALWRFWQIRGHLLEAVSLANATLSLEGGTPRERALALNALGGIEYWRGHWEQTLEPHRQALALLREHGTELEIAEATYNFSFPVGLGGDNEAAANLLLEALEIYRRHDDRIGMSRAHWGLGDLAAHQQDWDRELELMLEATKHLDGEDAPFDLGWSNFMMAFGYQHKGEDDAARRHLLIALEIFENMGDLSALTLVFESLGLNALRRGDLLRAARLAGAAEAIKDRTGVAITEVPMNRYEEYDILLESDDLATRSAFEEGKEMPLDEVIELARS